MYTVSLFREMFNGIVNFNMLEIACYSKRVLHYEEFCVLFLNFFLCHISLYKSNVFVLLGVMGQG